MGKRYLMDSNVVIDFLGGKLPESGKLFLLDISPEISVITLIEIYSKKEIPESEMLQYREFSRSSIVYTEISNDIAEHTIKLRKQYGLKTPDAIIAATAVVNRLCLITRNESDFKRIHYLDVINPWKI